MNKVHYQLEVIDITSHLVKVTLNFAPPEPQTELTLPAWIPGSYMVRDYAKHLQRLSAYDALGALAPEQLDKQRWLLSTRGQRVTVEYFVYGYDLSVRGNFIDDELAALNPCALCLAVTDLVNEEHVIDITVPQEPSWQVATGLIRDLNTAFLGQGRYRAKTYAQLIDSPLLLGQLQHHSFVINNIPHHVVLAGHPHTSLSRICTDLTAICQAQVSVFNNLPPDLTEYWFLCWVTDKGYGGLEHLNSTLLLLSHADLPNPLRPLESTENYRTFLGLCSHEYFHTWWVKRAKPSQFIPYQLQGEQYTEQLWLYEGFTSYFDDLALVRAGKMTQEQYLRALEQTINKVQIPPAERVQSVASSSFNAWTKYYKQDENAPNAVVSYYLKGSLIALCLQARLQEKGLALETLMQSAWQAFGLSGKGSDEMGFIELTASFAGQELAAELQSWVQNAAKLPLADCLAALGLDLSLRPQRHGKDWSGPGGTSYEPRAFGAQTQQQQDGLFIQQVFVGTPAHHAGLMAQDVLIAVNFKKASDTALWSALDSCECEEKIALHVFRRNRLLVLELTVVLAPNNVSQLTLKDPERLGVWLGETGTH